MRRVDWKTIVQVTRATRVAGELPSEDSRRGSVARVSTDTRALRAGDLFVALSGERFDGHRFVARAFEAGAAACVVAADRLDEVSQTLASCADAILIGVDEPINALERLAAWNRDACGFVVTAVTGSVGKTTTKEFLRAVLGVRCSVAAAPKSFNNRIGVALTLLGADDGVDHLVVEMGTSGRGEISHLSRLARPDHVVVTTVAAAHLSGLGSIDGVVEAKAEILDGLPPTGTAFINSRITGFERFVDKVPGELITFCVNGGSDTQRSVESCEPYFLENGGVGHRFTMDGETFELPVPGQHNLLNAAAAICVARHVGLTSDEIRTGLAACELPPQRLDVRLEGDVLFVDDSYNANPRSMESAIDTFEELADSRPGGRRIAVLGDMRELGEESRQLHEGVGRHLAAKPVDVLITVGEDSRYLSSSFREELETRAQSRSERASVTRVEHFDGVQGAREFLESDLRRGDKVLFKASNAVGVGQLAESLRESRRIE